MAKATSIRVILESISQTGGDCEQGEDRTYELSGYGEISYTHVEVAPNAVDQVITLLGDVTAIVILSLNGIPVDLRIDAAERLMENICVFAAGFGDANDDAMLASADGNLLVSGDTVGTADLLVVQIKSE